MIDLYRTLWDRRTLINFMVMRSRKANVFKTLLGHAWFVIGPLAQMGIYYFLIVVLFKRSTGEVHPLVFLMVGITHYLFFQQAINGGCAAIIGNQSLLMQIKIEPLVFIAIRFKEAIEDFKITLVLLAGMYLIWGPPLSWTALYYPVILAVLGIVSWCFCIIASSLTVFFRDIPHLVRIVFRLLMYMCPVVYSLSDVPESKLGLYLLNPIGTIFASLQWSLVKGQAPPKTAFIPLAIFLVVIVIVSHMLYLRLSPKFTKAF